MLPTDFLKVIFIARPKNFPESFAQTNGLKSFLKNLQKAPKKGKYLINCAFFCVQKPKSCAFSEKFCATLRSYGRTFQKIWLPTVFILVFNGLADHNCAKTTIFQILPLLKFFKRYNLLNTSVTSYNCIPLQHENQILVNF